MTSSIGLGWLERASTDLESYQNLMRMDDLENQGMSVTKEILGILPYNLLKSVREEVLAIAKEGIYGEIPYDDRMRALRDKLSPDNDFRLSGMNFMKEDIHYGDFTFVHLTALLLQLSEMES